MERMVYGILIFGIAGLVLIGAYMAVVNRRRQYEATAPEEDQLTDEQFRRIEFGEEER
jgi:hypothetical protein